MRFSSYFDTSKISAFASWIKEVKTIDDLDSPFLYHFYNNVVAKPIDDSYTNEIELIRKTLLRDTSVINITDHGAGSSINPNKSKTVKSIAKSAVSGKKKCQLIYKCIQHFKAQNILELGSSLGISSMYMQAADLNADVTTVEGDVEIYKILLNHRLPWAGKIKAVNSTFSSFIKECPASELGFDFIFIDGGHHSEILLPLVNSLRRVMSQNTVLIIDDIYWSRDMTAAWNVLKQNEAFNVKIDLWYFGILCYIPNIRESIDVAMSPIHGRWKLGIVR